MKLYFWFQSDHGHVHMSEKKPRLNKTKDGLAFDEGSMVTVDMIPNQLKAYGLDEASLKKEQGSFLEVSLTATSVSRVTLIDTNPPPIKVEALPTTGIFPDQDAPPPAEKKAETA